VWRSSTSWHKTLFRSTDTTKHQLRKLACCIDPSVYSLVPHECASADNLVQWFMSWCWMGSPDANPCGGGGRLVFPYARNVPITAQSPAANVYVFISTSLITCFTARHWRTLNYSRLPSGISFIIEGDFRLPGAPELASCCNLRQK